MNHFLKISRSLDAKVIWDVHFSHLFTRDKNKTFRPKKGFAQGTKRYDLHRFAQATLGR